MLRNSIRTCFILEVLHCLTSNILPAETADTDDLVSDLPGLKHQPNFLHYSGYLSGTTDNIQLHYWFIQAEKDADEAPLVAWFNGGPGCSSLDGLLQENGPFSLVDGSHLEYNAFSWNKLANMLYIETPAGVGFSYAKDGEYRTEDDQVALDNYHALKKFYEKFPAYKGRDFYLSGESYAGIYLPTLAKVIIDKGSFPGNFKGIFMGNPLTSYDLNFNSAMYFMHYHGLTDENIWNDLLDECCYDTCKAKCMFSKTNTISCENAITRFRSSLDSRLNVYDIYSSCHKDGVARFIGNHYGIFTNNATGNHGPNNLGNPILPCVDDTAIKTYLNRPEVQKALHVRQTNWELCSVTVFTQYKQTVMDISELVLDILNAKIRVTLFIGDVDLMCNHLGSLWFVENLKLTVKTPLSKWLFQDDDRTQQVGGMKKVVELHGTPLHYITVRGSGHMVPQSKPIPAFHLFNLFLHDSGQLRLHASLPYIMVVLISPFYTYIC